MKVLIEVVERKRIKMKLTKDFAFSDLENYLTNWVNFSGEGAYDFVGMLLLVKACLKNLSKNSIEADFGELEDFFSDSEVELLEKLL